MTGYISYTLRAPTEADAMAPAIEAIAHGFDLVKQDEQGNWQWSLASARHAFDPVGRKLVIPGTYNLNTGEELTPPVYDERFHANLKVKADIADQVKDLLITLGEPHGVEIGIDTGRVWA